MATKRKRSAAEPTINRRKLAEADVSFEVRIEADETCDETSIRGSFASGDPEYEADDRRIADEIIARLTNGDETAWCGVIVEARFEEHLGGDSIWGCCLSDDYTAETVVNEHGMRANALAALQAEVNAADAKDAGKVVLEAIEVIPDATLKRWISRGFATVVPLAKAELARRAIKR